MNDAVLDDVYERWRHWVIENHGDDRVLVAAAAAAGAKASADGKSFSESAEAAGMAWAAAKAERTDETAERLSARLGAAALVLGAAGVILVVVDFGLLVEAFGQLFDSPNAFLEWWLVIIPSASALSSIASVIAGLAALILHRHRGLLAAIAGMALGGLASAYWAWLWLSVHAI